ncbi:SPASM domain-containing protein [Candidatus Woesearchaeota archaeon]|nr:SPASM domain-containing protein [Candidatus Woesearchaeota archaeon]
MDNLKRLNLELSAFCGYKCVGCPNTYMEREKGSMSIELFDKIFSEIGGSLDTVYLANYGEPLLNKNIGILLELARNTRIEKVLSTTGAMLENFEDLEFLSALDELVISINGFDQETYAKHQKGGNFGVVKRGLAKLTSIMANANTNYVLQIVAHKHNLAELDKLEHFAHQYGFKTVQIKSFNVMDNNQSTFDEFIPLDTGFSRYKTNKFPERRTNIKAPCKEWMVVNWNGDVNPCCWDYEGNYIMGNVDQQGVFGVWNSPKMKEFRRNILNDKYLSICNQCGNSQVIKRYNIVK